MQTFCKYVSLFKCVSVAFFISVLQVPVLETETVHAPVSEVGSAKIANDEITGPGISGARYMSDAEIRTGHSNCALVKVVGDRSASVSSSLVTHMSSEMVSFLVCLLVIVFV